MTRDRSFTRGAPRIRLRLPEGLGCAGARVCERDPADIAPWVIAAVLAWPRSVEDRLVAVRIGIQPHHVSAARRGRLAS
jgi:hypothetical protein